MKRFPRQIVKLTMRGLLLLCLSGMMVGSAFSQHAGPNLYGRINAQILRMGHDQWVLWYCDPSRATDSGRRDAEVAYCLALHERNTKLLARKSPAEQQFFDECRGMFADMAKSAFVAGSEFYPEWSGWPVAIAESSTAVNFAIYELLSGGRQGQKLFADEVLSHWEKGLPTALGLKGGQNVGRESYQHMSGVVHRIAEAFEGRPKKEYFAAMRFCDAMVSLAATPR